MWGEVIDIIFRRNCTNLLICCLKKATITGRCGMSPPKEVRLRRCFPAQTRGGIRVRLRVELSCYNVTLSGVEG